MKGKKRDLQRVLIANRGEIAIRVAKAASAHGMESVSVYSSVDKDALHTRYTSRAVQIGQSGQHVEPYLDIDAVVQAAKETDCDCIHPGYGFLSENAELAEICEREGIKYVGPTSQALRLFGDKIAARKLAESINVPVIPSEAMALWLLSKWHRRSRTK